MDADKICRGNGRLCRPSSGTDYNPVCSSASVSRYIMENALFNQIEIDNAFMELMGYLRQAKASSYHDLVQLARKSPSLRAAWQLILVDVLLGLNLAEMAEDNALFEETATILCRRRAIPGAEHILSACFEVYADSIDSLRREFIRGCILDGSN